MLLTEIYKSACKRKKGDAGPTIPYLTHVESDARLQSIFDRIRPGRRFSMSEFTHFLTPLVQGFEAAAAGLFGQHDRVPENSLQA